jgi:glycosyltransferase involved in cell wall biosynthesis
MRVLALLATYNERRFVGACIEHLRAQGVETYLIDNCSTDGTVEIAERHLGRGLVGMEGFPRSGVYDWRGLLRRKEELARELEADWFMHVDADEVPLAPPGQGTLVEALGEVDRLGYNAVNLFEFTFVPSSEEPDHDHPRYRHTLQTYYPFAPRIPHRLCLWRSRERVDLASSGGHKVKFEGVRMYPKFFRMKHYLFLSVEHAVEKYVERDYDPEEVEKGWHGWRARLAVEDIHLPSASELRIATSDLELDPTEPRRRHLIEIMAEAA